MARTPFVAGNWKMNLDRQSAVALATTISKGKHSRIEVGVAVPFIYIEAVSADLQRTSVKIGAQDVFYEPNGAYTGEISIEMLKEFNVTFALAGHSERRHILKEWPELVAKKAAAIYESGMLLIHCIGETLEQRQLNQTLEVCGRQLSELSPARFDDPDRLVIAYEPVWAIGTGLNATEAQAQEVHAFIRDELAAAWNRDFADRVRIQYGGSMKPQNAAGLLSQNDVDGGLIGGAALKADSFLAICDAAADSVRPR